MIVRYTRQALADLDHAREYIALDNPQAAQAMATRIREAIDALRQFPERGRPGRVGGTRELVVPRTPFLVPYRVVGREIHVLAVLHGKRAWPPGEGA
ncbi:type II toxin-antitoxin system RelE/ParE family toxin [Falsiroseomonas sp. CW058]|uniref:type II toxin-antitoxin system RelE/ParE family toxin n=1 Tax=Falsiroseomonas sp. CW058 TaxID=3388664 RepID=UPI003D32099E